MLFNYGVFLPYSVIVLYWIGLMVLLFTLAWSVEVWNMCHVSSSSVNAYYSEYDRAALGRLFYRENYRRY